jgi:SAM-dependent methyltransferase
MTSVPIPQPLDPERYRSAAAHYERGRVPYAPALIRRVVEVVGLEPRHRVLDLGCGPGPLARRFAAFAQEVVAMDPTPEMLNAARTLADGIANIRFVAGSSYELGPTLGRFHLVVMGRSFHWMDRVDTLKRLDGLVESAGAVALFADTAPAIPANAWRQVWQGICDRYEPRNGAHRSDPNWIRHEAVLLDSPFARLERFSVIERRALSWSGHCPWAPPRPGISARRGPPASRRTYAPRSPESARKWSRPPPSWLGALSIGRGPMSYSSTIRGKWNDTTQFGTSTIELMRRSAQTLHSM